MVNILMSVLVGAVGLSLLLTAICIWLALKAVIELEAIKKSTHKVEIVKAEPDLSTFENNEPAYGPDIDKAYQDLLRRQQSAFPSFEDYFGPVRTNSNTTDEVS